MATSEPGEITGSETDREGLCTDTTCERSSGDTDEMNATSDTLTLARRDRESQEVETVNRKLAIDSEDNTSDTLTMAKLDRENQGPWEFEYSYGGEADLHRHVTDCEKNPGHKNFIPVDKFSIEDLPEDYRDQELVDYIRAVSDLTVRVTVKYVSEWRPETFPGTNTPYPGYSVRGKKRMTVGTGSVDSVDVYTSDTEHHCKCKDCRNCLTPEMHFAIVEVKTANHVVFDDLEAEHSTCHLFFDKGGTPDTCSGVVALTGMSAIGNLFFEDFRLMEHYTHDLALARKLQQTLQQMKRLIDNVIIKDKMWDWRLVKQNRDVLDKQPLFVLVSHPHGCSKQISLGYVTSAHVFNSSITSLLYNTATCLGSSGAHVIVPHALTSSRFGKTIIPYCAAHCGVSDEQHDVNFCRSIKGLLPSNWIYLRTLYLYTGPWEDNFCSVEEGDENQHYAACKKNPGHENFFPVYKFSMDHFPPVYRTDDIMKLVKLMSDLTVRVTVKYVSENRPETVPGTDIPYPWVSDRGNQLTRVGTGWIMLGEILDGVDCSCKGCRNSPKPNSPVAYIKIGTAQHLVYDELEVEHTTCDLFYDLEETSDDVCTSVVTLTDVCKSSIFPKLDITSVPYFTHDLHLVDSIRKVISQYDHTLRNIEDFMSKNIKQNRVDDAKQEPPLHIVVSHPHGCAKQIGICCCGNPNPGNADTEDSQCSHAAILCPGSSGARMIDLTWKRVYPCVE